MSIWKITLIKMQWLGWDNVGVDVVRPVTKLLEERFQYILEHSSGSDNEERLNSQEKFWEKNG